MIYTNNAEIVTFFNKAQNKIAQLGGLLADEKEDEKNERLLLDLSNFLEALDSPYNDWSEIDVIRYVHLWNKRADLNNIPYIQVTSYHVHINTGGNGELPDVEALIRDILSKYPHNNLAQIQGGITGERYHLTKRELDWIQCQMEKTPCPVSIDPTVGLTLTTSAFRWPSGYYELGLKISGINLQGSYTLNSGISLTKYRYKRGSSLLDETVTTGSPTINPFTDSTLIGTDTQFLFEADFQYGGTKQAMQQIQFRQPMYSGILKRNTITPTTAISLAKDVRDKGYMEITYTLPEGNTLKAEGEDMTSVIFFPASWGNPVSVKVLDYDFKPDWTFTPTTMRLIDGTNLPGILGVYNKQFEGSSTFKFQF